MRNIFLDRSPRLMIPDLLGIIPAWRPDMIIAGSFEYGGPLAAEKSGLSYANANYTIRWHPWILKHAVGSAIARLRKELGLPADPGLDAFGRYLDLCFAPPSWTFAETLLRPALRRMVYARVRSPDLPLRQRLWGMRALVLQRIFARAVRVQSARGATEGRIPYFVGEACQPGEDSPSLPGWMQGLPRQPTLFVSLGTVLSAEYPEIFEKILAGLADKPVNLIITLGGGGDPARFGSQPPNVRIVRFVTQDELRLLLPHVDLCINHAGYGSVMEALLRGIPLILLPLVSDAPMNTQMCLSSGVAPDLPPEVWSLSPKGLPVIRVEKLTAGIICAAVMEALHNPSYRDAARRMRAQLAERLTPDQAVGLLERAAGEAVRPTEAGAREIA